jgi:hypothetical protein
MNYDEVVNRLIVSKGNLRCQEICYLLEQLGFRVKSGKNFNHKVFSHQTIKKFHGGAFNCGHGKNPLVNKHYIGNILTILREYEEDIRNYLDDAK